MKTYALALAVGLLVGVIYSALNVRSPAPPVVALVGLLGILIGEQLLPMTRRLAAGPPFTITLATETTHHLFGALPGRGRGATPPPASPPPANPPQPPANPPPTPRPDTGAPS